MTDQSDQSGRGAHESDSQSGDTGMERSSSAYSGDETQYPGTFSLAKLKRAVANDVAPRLFAQSEGAKPASSEQASSEQASSEQASSGQASQRVHRDATDRSDSRTSGKRHIAARKAHQSAASRGGATSAGDAQNLLQTGVFAPSKAQRDAASAADAPKGSRAQDGPQQDNSLKAEALVRLLVDGDRGAIRQYVESVTASDISFAGLYSGLVQPAVRALDQMWMDDLIDFVDVTVGLAHLHGLVHSWSEAHPVPVSDDPRRSILFARMDGEAHTLGALIASICFEQAGWRVYGGYDMAVGNEFYNCLSTNPIHAVGLSIGCKTQLRDVKAVIAQVRRDARDRDIKVAVGGAIVMPGIDVCSTVGADLAASDAIAAVATAEAEFL